MVAVPVMVGECGGGVAPVAVGVQVLLAVRVGDAGPGDDGVIIGGRLGDCVGVDDA
jgi:hypothetical protein